MAALEYRLQLKDPRWQRRRLERLQLAHFACEECASTKKTLHVHHKKYRTGAPPWDYVDSELEVLCEDCHEARHFEKPSAADMELEERIARAYAAMLDAPTQDAKRAQADHMTWLVRQRSPAQITRMERRRSLR
jgi:hypothetical protein